MSSCEYSQLIEILLMTTLNKKKIIYIFIVVNYDTASSMNLFSIFSLLRSLQRVGRGGLLVRRVCKQQLEIMNNNKVIAIGKSCPQKLWSFKAINSKVEATAITVVQLRCLDTQTSEDLVSKSSH